MSVPVLLDASSKVNVHINVHDAARPPLACHAVARGRFGAHTRMWWRTRPGTPRPGGSDPGTTRDTENVVMSRRNTRALPPCPSNTASSHTTLSYYHEVDQREYDAASLLSHSGVRIPSQGRSPGNLWREAGWVRTRGCGGARQVGCAHAERFKCKGWGWW